MKDFKGFVTVLGRGVDWVLVEVLATCSENFQCMSFQVCITDWKQKRPK